MTDFQRDFFDEKAMMNEYDLPTAVAAFMFHFDLNMKQVAEVMGVSRRTVTNWTSGPGTKNDRMIRLAMIGYSTI